MSESPLYTSSVTDGVALVTLNRPHAHNSINQALLVMAAALCRASPVGATRAWWREGAVTESPNAGRPMAAMAGALGVELEKVGHYRLGSGGAAARTFDIDRAILIMSVACGLMASIAAFLIYARFHGA